MKTPIFDFLSAYRDSGTRRFHMPGHKGRSFLGIEGLDITEVAGADVLTAAEGIIHESECYTSELYDTEHTFFCTEGSTLAIKAMLKLATEGVTGTPTVLAGRNAHRAFISAAGLIGIDVEWIYPEESSHISVCTISDEAVRSMLERRQNMPAAVYITSPDYLGNIADIEGISRVCDEFSVPLLVDNAHGAYLGFLSPSRHPIALGAAMCADSAHKTLPALTGGAYLHISKKYPHYARGARGALSLFSSTSPSYLTLASLDLCNKYLTEGYRKRLEDKIRKTEEIKRALAHIGLTVPESEPLKITLAPAGIGYTGTELAELLRLSGIECEYSDGSYTVLMVSTETADCELDYLLETVKKIPKRAPKNVPAATFCSTRPLRAMSIREAIFAKSEEIPPSLSLGRICASPTVSCPPAIPIAVSGEIIDEATVKLMLSLGMDKISVIKQ
ncbi:MAG: amino acid decarboxylase [Clostridia bacterium]|nr:amino acid decarboxylase [Clostridia bacterium]